MPSPDRSVFVCGVQRAGTWLLAHLLESTGVLGHPAEFFARDDMRRFREAWSVSTDAEYLARVLEVGTSGNGVFSSKLMWNYLDDFLFRLRRLTCEYEISDAAVIAAVFPRPEYIWMWREDAVAQAVSWAKAAQTGQYAAHQRKTGEATFDFDFIDDLAHLARVQTGAWRRWFETQGIEPFEVTYEKLCDDQRGVIRSALARLGLEALPEAVIAARPELVKQADSVNAEWIRRYHEIARMRAET